jgi:hypothetical protein
MACCGVKEPARSAVEVFVYWEGVDVVLTLGGCWTTFMPLCCTDAFDGYSATVAFSDRMEMSAQRKGSWGV